MLQVEPTKRIGLSAAERRLQQLPVLAGVLGADWLSREYRRPIEQWSLVTGWISLEDNEFWHWLEDLDRALGFLKVQVSSANWQKITRKIRSHSNRGNFKGTLSEIAMCVFLASNHVEFEMENNLVSGSEKDVDFTAYISEAEPLHIDVQWLSPSERSEIGAAIAAVYNEGYDMDYEYEKRRIKNKIREKTSKFTQDDITFVAIDCTSSSELGGGHGYPVIRETFSEACIDRNLKDEEVPYIDSGVGKTIHLLVDGVIWYELEPGKGLSPVKRGFCLNPKSPHRKSMSISQFVSLWKPPTRI